MNYYYLDEQNRESGPVSLVNLTAFCASGVLKDRTWARQAGGGQCTSCGSWLRGDVARAAKLQRQALKLVQKQ